MYPNFLLTMQISCSRRSYFWLEGTLSHWACCTPALHWWCLWLCQSPEQQVTFSLTFRTAGTCYKAIDLTKKSTNRNNSVPPVNLVWLPGSVDNVQHAGLRRLGRGVEPRGGGQVQPWVELIFTRILCNRYLKRQKKKVPPCVCHEVRVVQQEPALSEHGLAELPVVEVVTQLLRSSAVILLELALPAGRVDKKK